MGSLELLDEAASEAASAQYNAVHGENVGVDAAGASDNYYKFVVDRVFYVGGLGRGFCSRSHRRVRASTLLVHRSPTQ